MLYMHWESEREWQREREGGWERDTDRGIERERENNGERNWNKKFNLDFAEYWTDLEKGKCQRY